MKWLYRGLKLQSIVALVLLRHHIWVWECASAVLFVLWRYQRVQYVLLAREARLLLMFVRKYIPTKELK